MGYYQCQAQLPSRDIYRPVPYVKTHDLLEDRRAIGFNPKLRGHWKPEAVENWGIAGVAEL